MGGVASEACGVHCNYCNYELQIIGNKISVTGSSASHTGLLLEYCSSTSANRNIIMNNFISLHYICTTSPNCLLVTFWVYGLKAWHCHDIKFLSNSINLYGDKCKSITMVLYECDDLVMLNNNIANSAGELVVSIASSMNMHFDHNNYYTDSTYVFTYYGTLYSTLYAFQQATGLDSNSVFALPGFYTGSDLHAYSLPLYHTGIPLTEVIDDYDGELRDTIHPCIGADEFPLHEIDVGITNIDEPLIPGSVGEFPIKVSLANFGMDTLYKVTINYSINGVQQAPYIWTGILPALDTLSNILIDSAMFYYEDYTIICWTESPNDSIDFFQYNDTANHSFHNCPVPFAGSYTIGYTGCDFETIYSALEVMEDCGIDSTVVFKIMPGTYTVQLTIDSIPGTSISNTITFTSFTGNSFDVTLTNSSSAPLSFADNAQHYIFDRLTIESSYIPVTVYLAGYDIRLTNNNITNAYTSFLTSAVISGSGNRLIIEGNEINRAHDGIFLSNSDSVMINNNSIQNFSDHGTYITYSSNIFINGNYFRKANTSCCYPNIEILGFWGSDGVLHIEKNIINGCYTSKGIRLQDCFGTVTNAIIIANNFISLNNSINTEIGLSMFNVSHVDVCNNSIEIYGPYSINNAVFEMILHNGAKIFNNIFSNTAGGYALVSGSSGGSAIDISDHNDIYSSGLVLGKFNGTEFTNLNTLQSLSGMDAHSLSVPAGFITQTDLHTNNLLLDGKAVPHASVTTDIDNEPRDLVHPDIGADEFSAVPVTDAGISAIVTPDTTFYTGSTDVTVTIHNYGNISLTDIPIRYEVDGISYPVEYWTGVLNPAADLSYTFSGNFTAPNQIYELCAYTLLANDSLVHNDSTCGYYNTNSGVAAHDQNCFFLSQNQPNPADVFTTIQFNVPCTGEIILEIRNTLGQSILTKTEKVNEGIGLMTVNTAALNPGVYLYGVSFEGKKLSRLMLVEH